jgi:hypothetical protein
LGEEPEICSEMVLCSGFEEDFNSLPARQLKHVPLDALWVGC